MRATTEVRHYAGVQQDKVHDTGIHPVLVTCRHPKATAHRPHGTYEGLRWRDICVYHYEIPGPYAVRGDSRLQRMFVMIDDGIQLCRPITFPERYADWWYVDVVDVVDTREGLTVVDRWLDVVVPPAGTPYQLRDLDEFGEAAASGALTPSEVRAALRDLQRFIDLHLQGKSRPFEDVAHSWSDFPPERVLSIDSAIA